VARGAGLQLGSRLRFLTCRAGVACPRTKSLAPPFPVPAGRRLHWPCRPGARRRRRPRPQARRSPSAKITDSFLV
jgi:hypothetical protein